MSIERTNRLRYALEQAKSGLSEEGKEVSNNPSKLGRLLNKVSKVSDERRFISSQPIHERPVMDAIGREVLGEDTTYEPIIHLKRSHPYARLKDIRERNLTQTVSDESLGGKIGFSLSGQPLWSSILDEQRGMQINALPPELSGPSEQERIHHRNVLSTQIMWPHRLQRNQQKTFKQWQVNPENQQSTNVCESIVDNLGKRHNPHLIVGEHGVGKSHLLHATGQSVLRYYDDDVRIVRATELLSMDESPKDWHESLASTALILIDDVHLIAEHKEHAQSLGHLVDHALNLGVHVLCASASQPQGWTSSRLWELLRHASISTMHPVSEISLAMYIKRQSSLLGMLFEDAHIMEILNHAGHTWRGVEAALSQLKDAKERGNDIFNPEDVVAELTGTSAQVEHRNDILQNSEISLASDIVKRATDVVYSDLDVGGIELHTSAIEQQEDDWEPSQVTTEDLMAANDLLEVHLKTTLEDLTPEAPSVLDSDANDRHLTHQLGTIEGEDIVRTADVLASIDESIDEALAERERTIVADDLRLQRLELKMEELLERTAQADANQLIDIVDELRYIEHELGLVSEDEMEAFEMEDETLRIAHLSKIMPTNRRLFEEE